MKINYKLLAEILLPAVFLITLAGTGADVSTLHLLRDMNLLEAFAAMIPIVVCLQQGYLIFQPTNLEKAAKRRHSMRFLYRVGLVVGCVGFQLIPGYLDYKTGSDIHAVAVAYVSIQLTAFFLSGGTQLTHRIAKLINGLTEIREIPSQKSS